MTKAQRMADCHPDKPHWARGFCGTCYQRWWNEQNPGRRAERIKANRRPSGCHPEKPELARGLCNTCYRRQWRLENPLKNWESQNAYQKRKYAESETTRRTMILRRYGLTPADYDRMLAAQGGVCAVCGDGPQPRRRLQVDHCHATEKVRALLCANCNSALGHAKESVERLEALVRYLRTHQ